MEKEQIVNIIHKFKELNKNKYEIVKIGFFGSAAKGILNENSDIDVVVELKRPDLFYLIGIKQDLEKRFNRSVDIVRYREKMNKFLKTKIDSEAVYV